MILLFGEPQQKNNCEFVMQPNNLFLTTLFYGGKNAWYNCNFRIVASYNHIPHPYFYNNVFCFIHFEEKNQVLRSDLHKKNYIFF